MTLTMPILQFKKWAGVALGFLLYGACASLVFAASNTERPLTKMALVIGNGAYAAHPLRNAVNDATLISNTLRGVGFEVIQGNDVTRKQFQDNVDLFREKAENADVALIYYAGHGVQIQGKNYLIPVELDPKDEKDIIFRSINLDRIVEVFNTERRRVNVMIIDACRDNPFGFSRSIGTKGLAEIQRRPGTLIAYSTSPGSTATDGAAPNGRNSIYSYALSQAMLVPNLPIEQAFKNVRRDVLRATANRQTPWEVTSLIVPFSFSSNNSATLSTADASSSGTQGPTPNAVKRSGKKESNPEDDEPSMYQSPEEARQELAKMGIAWTDQGFARSLKRGDTIAAKLFIRGGMDVFSVVDGLAAIGYVACGDQRAKTLNMLHHLNIDLNKPYERNYRLEGVRVKATTTIILEWFRACPSNDLDFAKAVVANGLKWPKEDKLDGDYKQLNMRDSLRGAFYSREAIKVLIRGKAFDPAYKNYDLYLSAQEPFFAMIKNDTEFMKLVSPPDIAAFNKKNDANKSMFNKTVPVEESPPNFSIGCAYDNSQSMGDDSECIRKRTEQWKKEHRKSPTAKN